MQTARQVVDSLLRKKPAERIGLHDGIWGDTLRKWADEEDYPRDANGNPVSQVEHFDFDLQGVGGWFDKLPLRNHQEVLDETDEWIIRRNGAELVAFFHALDALEPIARDHNVRIAIENGDFRTLGRLFAAYPPDYLGLCYDCGHGNMIPDGLDRLDTFKDRLISIHLHDNDGQGDQHKLLFTGTVDWPRLAALLAASAYAKCISMEVVMRNTGIDSEAEFLQRAHQTGAELTSMVDAHSRSQ